MNNITLEMSQATETKVFSDDFAGAGKESSTLFSNLMDKNKDHQQSGKSITKNGNEEPNHLNSNSKRVNKNEVSIDKRSVENSNKLDNQVEEDIDNTAHNETAVAKEDAIKEGEKESSELLVESALSDDTLTNDTLSNSPEKLLSFLNASEKVLSKNKNETPLVLDQKVETDLELKANSELKTDKTLLAQSATEQISIEEASRTKKANELLKLQDVERTKGANLSTAEVDDEQSLTKNNLLNELVAGDKKQTSEDQKLSVEKSLESKLNKATRTEAIQEATLNEDSEKSTELNEESLQSTIANINKDVKLTEESDKKTSTDTKVTAGDTKPVDKVIEQSKPQATSETIENIESEEVGQALTQTKSTVQPENFNEQVKNVSANNIVPNRFDQRMEKGNKSSQDQALNKVSEKALENTEDITELASEDVKDELLNTELKTVNNNKINQNIAPVLDPLTQREVSSRIGSEAYIEDELSFENVMQTMSSDLAKAQKNTAIQHVETISIMRKDFTDAVKDKVMVMINQRIQQVDIQLDPPELGNMQVRINMQNEQAVVSFVVQNQQAKEALDQNMDRLKQMMSENGVDVGESNVKQESNQSSMQEGDQQAGNGSFNNNADGSLEGSMNMEHTKVLKASSTGVDYYV
jgi:flagellar hook-length control protein FliK